MQVNKLSKDRGRVTRQNKKTTAHSETTKRQGIHRQTNYGLITEHMDTIGEQTNDMTGTGTGLEQKQKHIAKQRQAHHMNAKRNDT